MNPTFLWLLLYKVKIKTNLWEWIVDTHRGNAGSWYQDDKGLPDLLSKPM
jgi:hypothetical protein